MPIQQRLLTLIKIIVGPLLLLLLLRTVGLARLGESVRQAEPAWLGLALAAYLGTVGLRAYRWGVLLRAQGIRLPLARLVQLDLLGSFWNLVLPTSVGGDVAKFYALTRGQTQGSFEAPRVLSSLLADRLCGLVVLLWLGVAVLPLAGERVAPTLAAGLAAAGLGAAVGLALLLHPALRRRAEQHAGLRWLLARRGVQGVYGSLSGYRPTVLLHAAGASFVFNVTMIAVYVALGRAFGVELPVTLYAVAVPLITLAQALPLAPNGLGVREGAFLLFLGQVGVTPTLALSMGLAYYGCTVVTGLLGGLLVLAGALPVRNKQLTPEGTEGVESVGALC